MHAAKHDAEPAWKGKNEEEGIILFEETGSFYMMVFV
jgi:hypothetical protein